MYGMLMMLPAFQDHPLTFFKEARAGCLFLITPETQKNFIRIHMIRMTQTASPIRKAGTFSESFHFNAGNIKWP